MKQLVVNLKKMAKLALLGFVFLNSGCGKGTINPLPTATETNVISIDLIGLKSDSGYAYKIGYNLPQIGDSNTSSSSSTLRLFENGVELGPAHSNHSDIRKYGLGQFSHWGAELYFSTSDNSNPLTNGRKYTYIMH